MRPGTRRAGWRTDREPTILREVLPLSRGTRTLVERLARPPGGLWGRLWAGWRRRGTIEAIGRSGEVAAIAPLLSSLIAEAAVAEAASRAIADILRRQAVACWPMLEQIRGQVRRGPQDGWSTLAPSQVPRLGLLAAGWAALGMASLHPDGRVRAAAVGALQGRVEGDRAELAFLLLRLNDWAEPVRTIARAAIEARLGVGHVDAWVHASPLVEALAQRSRVEHRSTIDAVTELLRAPAARRALQRGTTALDLSWPSPRFIIDIGVADGALVRRGLLDGDPRVRRAVAGQLRRMPDDDDWLELLILAIRHRDGEVHRLGLAALVAQPAARQRRVFKRLLLDRMARSRRVARDGMRRLDPGFDAPAWYRYALAVTRDPVDLAAAIQGYGECEEAVDIAVLAPFYRHAKNRVKAAASIATTRITRRIG